MRLLRWVKGLFAASDPDRYMIDGDADEFVDEVYRAVATGCESGSTLVALVYVTNKGRHVHHLMSKREFEAYSDKLASAGRHAFGPTYRVPCNN